MSFQIALNFEDGVSRFIHANAEETIADAAYRQGVNIPLDCRDGACGTCKCLAEAGQYELGEDYIDDALTEAEAAQGYVLTCQMRALSDCVLQVPVAAALCKTREARYQGQISAVQALSASTFALSLSGAGLADLAFLPGQYVNLQVPGTEQQRAYSFSSLLRAGEVSFLIRNVPGGLMSRYLSEQAQVGDSISLAGPLGCFYLRPVTRGLLLLAGGTGLAPLTAMLEQLAEQGCTQPLHLLYGVTAEQDLVALARLDALAQRLPNFSYRTCVADPHSSHPHKGYVIEHIDAAQLNDGDVDIYLCGPPPMVEAVSRYLNEQGIRPANFYYEKFSPSAA